MTTKPDTTTAKKAIMAAARHLSATRMAWVMNRYTSGIDWRGCAKGSMAQKAASGDTYDRRNPAPISDAALADLTLRLRCATNTRSETGLRPEDSEAVLAKVASLRARAAKLSPALALHEDGTRVNHRVAHDHQRLTVEADRLTGARPTP